MDAYAAQVELKLADIFYLQNQMSASNIDTFNLWNSLSAENGRSVLFQNHKHEYDTIDGYQPEVPPSKPIGSTRNKGSVCALGNLEKAQCLAMLAITGTLRSSPNDYVDIHASVLPMDLALLKACHNALVRSLTLPSTNPIHQIIRKAKRHLPTKHLGPMDNLLKLFSLANVKVETIYPAITIKREKRYETKIDNTREDSIANESHDDADFKVFSDGSGQDNGVGSAAIKEDTAP